jgi:hypothetical protein
MKYLKKYENKSDDLNESEFDIIKDILLEIKDSYPAIDGEILKVSDKRNDFPNLIYIIKLDCSEIKLEGHIWTLEYYDSKMKFLNLIKDVCHRIERALSVKVRIPNFDDFDHWQYAEMKIQLFKL